MRINTFNRRSILSVGDLSSAELREIVELSVRIRNSIKAGLFSLEKTGERVALMFQDSSPLDELAVETAASMLGMGCIHININAQDVPEPYLLYLAGVAGRMVGAIAASVNDSSSLSQLQHASGLPIINCSGDMQAPLHAIASLITLKQKFGDLTGLRVGYIGSATAKTDSFLFAAAKTGCNIKVYSGEGSRPHLDLIKGARDLASQEGGSVTLEDNLEKVYADVNVVYVLEPVSFTTDGSPADTREAAGRSRAEAGRPLMITRSLRPADFRSNQGPQQDSLAFELAENRLYATIAILYSVL